MPILIKVSCILINNYINKRFKLFFIMKKYYLMKGDQYITHILIKCGDSPFYPVVMVNSSPDVKKCLYFSTKKAAEGLLNAISVTYTNYKFCSLHVKEF